MNIVRRYPRVCIACGALLVLLAASVPVAYWAVLNTLGPSTEYHEPYIVLEDAELAPRLPDGRYVAYVGERIYVRYTVVRHKINGDCLLNIFRYGEYIGGPRDGKRELLDYADLQFSGANDLLRPRWPVEGLVLTDALIPAGRDEQELALYVIARYHCNPLDEVFPRHLQGGVRSDETVRVNLIVRRKKR